MFRSRHIPKAALDSLPKAGVGSFLFVVLDIFEGAKSKPPARELVND